jgi:hypothetical protein
MPGRWHFCKVSLIFFMKMPPAVLLLAATLAASLCQAETLFETDFASQRPGDIAPGQTMTDRHGTASFWQGPQIGEFGHFAIVDAPESAGAGAGKRVDRPVLAFFDNSPAKDKAPTFSIELSKPSGESATVVVEARLLVPVGGPYLGLIGIGKGSWDGAAALFTLSDGKINARAPGDVSTTVGDYVPNEWFVFRVTLDVAKKTFDVQIGGKKTASGIPWAHTEDQNLTFFEFLADMLPLDRMAEPVLYMESVKITSDGP